MAAKLKKRALAEFSHVIEKKQKPAAKKLRLVKRATPAGHVNIENELAKVAKAQKASEASSLLLEISESLPDQVEDSTVIIQRVIELCQKQTDAAVRRHIYSLLRDMLMMWEVDYDAFLDDLLALLKKETSHKALAKGITMLKTVSQQLPEDSAYFPKMTALVKEKLNDGDYLVTCNCLSLLCRVVPITSESENMMSIFLSFSKDQDARVRTSAFAAVLELHSRGLKLDPRCYGDVCKALDDDYEKVRQSALQLVFALSQSAPEKLIDIRGSDESIRLVDDAFAHVCNAINDLCMDVRAQAAAILGKMHNVSQRFLEQTLDKKLMSNMKVKHSFHEKARKAASSGNTQWSSGKKWGDDGPGEEVDADSLTIMSMGACGAFIHGLEDEFLEVRTAAVDSLLTLSERSDTFAQLCIDFLVDMFNDEIEEVRLKAIGCLKAIGEHITLRDDQLDIILAVLEDSSLDIREALHNMLSSSRLSTKYCLKMCVNKLLENLKRYPQDRRSIWRCLQALGSNHPHLTLALVPEFLVTHPYFDVPEREVQEPGYRCLLILMFNAAQSCHTMIPLFSEHTIKHYHYLRHSLPHLVPRLKIGGESTQIERAKNENIAQNKARAFLEQALGRASGDPSTALSDLERLSTIHPDISAAADFAANYVQCFQLLTKAASLISLTSVHQTSGQVIKDQINKLLKLSFRLQHLYSGCCKEEKGLARQLRLQILSLHLFHTVKTSNTSALQLTYSFINELEQVHRYVGEPGAFLTCVWREVSLLEDPKPGTVARFLEPMLKIPPPIPTTLNPQMKMAGAVIYEPSGESDSILKFTAGLILGVPLDCEVSHVADLSSLRIQVQYPDGRTHRMVPRSGDLRPVNEHTHRLLTTVLLSHQVWTEACYVSIQIVLDLSEQSYVAAPLPLCEPVKVLVSAKPVRRGF